jgi:hypothetical protein
MELSGQLYDPASLFPDAHYVGGPQSSSGIGGEWKVSLPCPFHIKVWTLPSLYNISSLSLTFIIVLILLFIKASYNSNHIQLLQNLTSKLFKMWIFFP